MTETTAPPRQRARDGLAQQIAAKTDGRPAALEE